VPASSSPDFEAESACQPMMKGRNNQAKGGDNETGDKEE
jgi:hypothetical protein